MKKRPPSFTEDLPKLKDWLTLLLLSLIWGSSFILIKKSLIAMSAPQMASMRIAISSLAFIPVLVYQRKNIEWNRWKDFLLIGLLGSGIPAFCYAFAQTQLNSSVTGLLNSLTPLFTFLIGVLFFRSSFKVLKITGLLLGLVGASLLILYDQDSIKTNLFYAAFIVIGTLCYGANVNFIKSNFQSTKPIIVSAFSFVMIGLPALFYLITSGAFYTIGSHPDVLVSLPSVLILSLFGTVLATVLYFSLVQSTSPVFASSVAYLMPVVAMFWGYLDGESFGVQHLVSFIFILLGIYLIRK